MDSNQFHQQHIEHEMTKEIIKGAVYNQRMSELSSNTASQVSIPSGSKTTVMGGYYPIERKVYKSQKIALGVSLVVGMAGIIAIVIFFS